MGVDAPTRARHAAALQIVSVERAMTATEQAFSAGELGYPNLIFDLSTARRLRRLAQPEAPPRLLELGVPSPLLAEVLSETAPSPGMGVSGLHLALQRRRALGPGTCLGYELVALELGGVLHSSACNDLGPALAERFGAQPNPWGLIDDLEVALRCAEALTNEALPCARLLWVPFALSTPSHAALPPTIGGAGRS